MFGPEPPVVLNDGVFWKPNICSSSLGRCYWVVSSTSNVWYGGVYSFFSMSIGTLVAKYIIFGRGASATGFGYSLACGMYTQVVVGFCTTFSAASADVSLLTSDWLSGTQLLDCWGECCWAVNVGLKMF